MLRENDDPCVILKKLSAHQEWRRLLLRLLLLDRDLLRANEICSCNGPSTCLQRAHRRPAVLQRKSLNEKGEGHMVRASGAAYHDCMTEVLKCFILTVELFLAC
ncbi:hypothetical protein CFC21_040983 [Triticum aestivum]|uniref:Uncharacterized protein n=2 Tax=Triticum aestivum TaxID=4565 RepID=A0A9R1JTM0_WHEAT|nr:hypothetical protein CFC21_040983 [Triticum aestivum]